MSRLTRRQLLAVTAAVAVRPEPGAAQAQPSAAGKFAERTVEDIATAVRGSLSYIGDRLGIFKAMAAAGPVTVDELARKTGLSARYLREWLGAMTAAQYVQYTPDTHKFLLPPDHAAVLADEESPLFLGGMFQILAPAAAMAPRVAQAFRDGKGVPQSEYPADVFEGICRSSAPNFKHQLVQQWIPAMPQAAAKLRDGGSALDVGCGWGLAPILIAKAFPKARVFGYDLHAPSIERARASAKAAGVADRVTFEVVDGAKIPANRFDFVSSFDVLHDSADPVAIMTSVRKALAPEGTYLVNEPNLSPRLEENINLPGRMLYAVTTMYCMSVSLANGGAGIGADINESLLQKFAGKSGFSRFRRLPVGDAFSGLFELRA